MTQQASQASQPKEERQSTSVSCLALGTTCSYLLACASGYLLIDTAYPNAYPTFLKALEKLGVDPKQIKYLLLTHHHDDHAGFAAQLVNQTGCTVIAHQRAVPPLSRGAMDETIAPVNRRMALVLVFFRLVHPKFTFPPLQLSGKDLLVTGDDSDVLKGIGIDGVILATPGHSNDSISVLLSDGRAFVGDVAMNNPLFNACGIRYRPIYVEEREAVFDSWRKLIAHGAKTLYPAHTNPIPARELLRTWPQYFREHA